MSKLESDDHRFSSLFDNMPLKSIDDIFFNPKQRFLDTLNKVPSIKSPIEGHTCKSCGKSDVYEDSARGEVICVDCGNVIDHHTPEFRGVRVYDIEDLEKVQNEPMSPSSRPVIKVKTSDVNARRRAMENNKLEWKYKKLVIMKIELDKLKNRLPFSKDVENRAMEEIKKVFSTDILRGRSAIPMAMALLYYSCIKCNSPIGLKDILDSLYVIAQDDDEERRMRRGIRMAIKTLSKEMDYKFTVKTDYAKFLLKVCNGLSMPQYICTDAIKMFKQLKETYVFSGDPIGYAAACLWYANMKHDDKTPAKQVQKTIADAVRMTPVTIRKRAKELKPILENMIASPIQS
jgi:transcription initiation factor TFIIB